MVLAAPEFFKRPPAITVLVPAYNAAPYIQESLISIFQQTFTDFEVVVVNDASTDGTRDVLSQLQDERLKILDNKENLGIVASLNRGLSVARGAYIARIDADDYCTMNRLELQKRFLDDNPSILLIGAGGQRLISGKLHKMRIEPEPDPIVLRWLFHILNPIGHSSMMFRKDAVLRMGEYMREEFRYAEDFDFSHRMLAIGTVGMLNDSLLVYRILPESLSRGGIDRVVAKTTSILQTLYAPLLGPLADEAATLIGVHIVGSQPVPSISGFERLGIALEALADAFLEHTPLLPEQRRRIARRTAELWWQAVLVTARHGFPLVAAQGYRAFRWWYEFNPSPFRIARAGMGGLLRLGHKT